MTSNSAAKKRKGDPTVETTASFVPSNDDDDYPKPGEPEFRQYLFLNQRTTKDAKFQVSRYAW